MTLALSITVVYYYYDRTLCGCGFTRLMLRSNNILSSSLKNGRVFLITSFIFFLASPDHVIRQTTGHFSLRKQNYVGWGEGKLDRDTWPGTNRELASCRGRSAAIGIRQRRPSRPRPDLRPVLLTGPLPPRAHLI